MISGLVNARFGQYSGRPKKASETGQSKSAGEFGQMMSTRSKKPPVKDSISAKDMEIEIPARKKATAKDIAELAAKYDPERMSRREYVDFLDELVDRGLVNKDELESLGYYGYIPIARDTGEDLPTIIVYDVPDSSFTNQYRQYYDPLMGRPDGFEYFKGNMLALAKNMAAWKPSFGNCKANVAFNLGLSESFASMSAILEAMKNGR